MKITLFSQWECKTCIALKKTLDQEKINYKVIEVLENKELWEEIRKQQLQIDSSSIMYTPTLLSFKVSCIVLSFTSIIINILLVYLMLVP